MEKNEIIAIERITGIHRDTVSDVAEDLARNAKVVTGFLIKDIELTEVQVDEMLYFIKNKKTFDLGDDDADKHCDYWIYIEGRYKTLRI